MRTQERQADITPLIIRHLHHDTTEEEEAWLQEQLDKDPSVKALFAQLQEEFRQPELQRLVAELPDRLPTATMYAFAQRQKRVIFLKRFYTIAAALVIICLASWFFMFPKRNTAVSLVTSPNKMHHVQLQVGTATIDLSQDRQQVVGQAQVSAQQKTVAITAPTDHAESATLTVPAGKFYNLHLPDGSKVFVNSATTVTFPTAFTGNSRDITIDGEAFVEVAPNAHLPFLVHFPQGTVRVLGTSFNINTYTPHQANIALVKGAVQVNAGGDAAVLRPGYAAAYSEQSDKLQVAPFDTRILSWKDGTYYFHNTPLPDLCQALARWYGVEVVLDKAALSGIRLTGTIHRDEPVDTFLDNINLTSGLTFYQKDGAIHIK
ncbi:FecR family protein [Chitinophaga costaii]|uniref:FecR family protein n=1 Tax=Chitinophaga costaii TaxID=1335309 RepID=A0A1C3YQW2_9BACT|nr:FecR domain-containing protein [Chitinophaga costaii]SCB72505.1 FecR family protein [Chitinophaga costaii]